MIESKKTRQNHWNKRRIKKEVGDSATADDVLEYILGDYDGCGGNDYVLYRYDDDKRSIMNRVNLLWVWPIFAIIAIPTWLITGGTGISRHSKIGRVVNWLVRLD